MTTQHSVRTDDGKVVAAWVDGPESCSDAALTYVLAHGWTLNHTSWDRVTARLFWPRSRVPLERADDVLAELLRFAAVAR